MKQIFIAILIAFTATTVTNAQTTKLSFQKDFGVVKKYSVHASSKVIGQAYTIETGKAKASMLFYPEPKDLTGTFIFTGTYTSKDDKVAGEALNDQGKNVGTPDKDFEPNAYLVIDDSTLSLNDASTPNSVQVYKVLDEDKLLDDVISKRKSTPIAWRFMVSKYWEKWDSVGGKRLDYGTDIIIVDLNSAMTLLNATKVIQGMAAKNLKGKGFVYTSQISAAILPSASYRPVLIKGSSVGGSFIKKQSNLIAIK